MKLGFVGQNRAGNVDISILKIISEGTKYRRTIFHN